MNSDQFDPNWFTTPEELRIKAVTMHVELKERRGEIARLRTELADANADLLIQGDLTTRLALAEERLKHTQRTWKSRVLAVFVGVLNIVAVYLYNYGNSLITSTPSDQNGYYMLAIAGIIYFMAFCTTVFILAGNHL